MPKFGEMPKQSDIAKNATAEFLKKHGFKTLDDAKMKGLTFSSIIEEIQQISKALYFDAERLALRKTLLEKGIPEKDVDKILDLFVGEDTALIKSVQNTRMARGGSSAQNILVEILKDYGVPAEAVSLVKGRKEGYRLDIAIPSIEKLNQNPKNALALAVKRTLRERWHSDLPIFEHYPNAAFVLMEYDDRFNEQQAKDMVDSKMRKVYIPDRLYKASSGFIGKYKQFKPLSELPSDAEKFKVTI